MATVGKYLLLVILFAVDNASAQVTSGTIVIFNFTEDKVVVAADSLAGNEETGIPDDSHCKIAAFGHKFVFASVGSSGWSNSRGLGPVHGWDNIDLAKQVFHSGDDIDLTKFSSLWGTEVKNRWGIVNRLDPQRAMNIAAANDQQFTSALFVDKKLRARVVLIRYNRSSPSDPIEVAIGEEKDLSNCWPCGQLGNSKICAAGKHLDIAAGFCSKRKHGDAIPISTRLRKADKSAELTTEIVELTNAAYERTAKDVGGKVDVVTITKDGTIDWLSRKSNCPDNQ
jgi:hypothetical protein